METGNELEDKRLPPGSRPDLVGPQTHQETVPAFQHEPAVYMGAPILQGA